MMAVKDSAVAEGFKHLETIAALHFHRPPQEQMEAVTNVMASFGMDDEAIQTLVDNLGRIVPEEYWQARGWVMMGFIAGLSTAQNSTE